MIKRKKTDYEEVAGDGRNFEMNPRGPIEKTTAERTRPVIINLSDLNNGKRVPKNFHRKAGRCLASFMNGVEDDDTYDIE